MNRSAEFFDSKSMILNYTGKKLTKSRTFITKNLQTKKSNSLMKVLFDHRKFFIVILNKPKDFFNALNWHDSKNKINR